MERVKKSTIKTLTRKDIDDTLDALNNHYNKTEYVMLFGKKGLEMFDEVMNHKTWKDKLIETLKSL